MTHHSDYQLWKRKQIKQLGWAILAFTSGQLLIWLVSLVIPMSDDTQTLCGIVTGAILCELGRRYYHKKNKHHES
jgi:hypothetical protein